MAKFIIKVTTKFIKLDKFKDLWALEQKERFRLLFNLETLKIEL